MEIKPLNIKDGSKYKLHPLCEMLPTMDDDGLKKLTADIKANGLMEPIVIFQGRILDGRHRHAACMKAKVKPVFEELVGESLEAWTYILSKNLHRRHLTKSQIAALVGATPAVLKAGGTGANQHVQTGRDGPSAKDDVTTQAVADKVGISKRTLKKGRQLNKDGEEEVVKAVRDGKLTIDEGLEVASLPKGEQKEVLEEKVAEKATPKKREKPPKPEVKTYDVVYVSVESFTSKQLSDWETHAPKRGHLGYIRCHPSEAQRAFDLANAWGRQVVSVLMIKRNKANVDNVTRGDHDICLIVANDDDISIPLKERPNNCLSETEFTKHLKSREGKDNLLLGDARMDGWEKS